MMRVVNESWGLTYFVGEMVVLEVYEDGRWDQGNIIEDNGEVVFVANDYLLLTLLKC